MLVGCAAQLTEQQRMWLDLGQRYYEREDYARAVDQLNRFLSEVPEGPEAGRALYLRGLSNGQAGQRAQAYADLRRCIATSDDRDVVWRAYLVLGTLHYEDGQWNPAAQHLRAALERMPAVPPKDAALYRLGLCLERSGQWRAASQAFSEIVRDFSGGTYAEPASRRLHLNASHFAVQCGAFRQESNAQTLCSNLKQEGLEAYIRQERRGRTPMYVVLVGRYAGYEQVLRQLAMIRQHFVADAIVWP